MLRRVGNYDSTDLQVDILPAKRQHLPETHPGGLAQREGGLLFQAQVLVNIKCRIAIDF